MTTRKAAERGNPSVAKAAKAIEELTLTGDIAPPVATEADARSGRCVTCGRTVDPMAPVSHGIRGPHTCTDPAGVTPPYLDPANEVERGATDIYRAARQAARHHQAEQAAAADPTRPF